MQVSVIIPTYNEEESIGKLLNHLKKYGDERLHELIVIDGGSDDRTVEIARKSDARCLVCKKKGRAAQMNMGYRHSSGDLLYFVHADSFPPETYLDDLQTALKNGCPAGCYRFQFDSDRLLLKVNSYFTRFDRIMCRGGDQTLFIRRKLFEKLGGFRDDFMIMEDYDLIQKIQRKTSFKIIPKDVTVSARKYDMNPYLKVNFANFVVFMMYFFGARQQTMVSAYKNLIHHPKL
ncbi:MAG: TIGR04283 family arsenosugar biosynthesis glycosyltransferase [Balneolaceae bacterium]|nr:TIGR04283 family arsenosugar biosynthesis glycosyltransferase [Balneolaceae bacterium]